MELQLDWPFILDIVRGTGNTSSIFGISFVSQQRQYKIKHQHKNQKSTCETTAWLNTHNLRCFIFKYTYIKIIFSICTSKSYLVRLKFQRLVCQYTCIIEMMIILIQMCMSTLICLSHLFVICGMGQWYASLSNIFENVLLFVPSFIPIDYGLLVI